MTSYQFDAIVRRPSKKMRIAVLCFFLALAGGLGVFYQRQISFSYLGQECFRDFTVLPGIFEYSSDGTYRLTHSESIKVSGYPLFSAKTCVTALAPPAEKQAQKLSLSILGLPIPNKTFSVVADEYPKLDTSKIGQKISIREPLIFKLDKPDKLFDYKLSAGTLGTDCQSSSTLVFCETAGLGLKHNHSYEIKIERHYNNQLSGEAAKAVVTTVEPLKIIKTAPAPNAFVYDKPSEISLWADRNVATAEVELKISGLSVENVEHEVKIAGNQIKLLLKNPLKRDAAYEVLLKDAVAEDKGVLFEPYKLMFKTSAGPKVLGVNIGGSSVEPGTTITVSFDQNLASDQNLAAIVSSSSPGIQLEAKANKLYIKKVSSLPICTKFSIKMNEGIVNQYGVGGSSAWSFNSRIRCYTTQTIGYSSQGRAITAWRFGSGATKFVYFGTTHGNEKSTKYLLDRWIRELDGNFDKIPANASVFVIPNLNPDGFSANSRRNARNVDLNRNFPANDWKKDVTMPSGELVINGGGTIPLSEPESQAIANFVQAQAPRLVITYHSVADIVSGNAVGIADGAAITYADLSGYNYSAFGEEETVFKYDTTGAFETWLHDKVGIPSVLVELGSHTNSEFSQNRSAMWKMLSY